MLSPHIATLYAACAGCGTLNSQSSRSAAFEGFGHFSAAYHRPSSLSVKAAPASGAARLALFDYIEGFYNTHRRHSALDYLSPAAYERR